MVKNEDFLSLEYINFIEWLEKQEIEYNEEDIIRDWEYIKIDIYAELGNHIWGKNINYKLKSLYDTQILESIKQLNN